MWNRLLKQYFFVARLQKLVLQCNVQLKKWSTKWLRESYTCIFFNISSLAPLMREPSPLSHVSLTRVLKSTTSSSRPCAPHASVSLSPYSCKFQPSPPALQPQLLRLSRSIQAILPIDRVQSFSRCCTQLWPYLNPWGIHLTKLHSESCADTTECVSMSLDTEPPEMPAPLQQGLQAAGVCASSGCQHLFAENPWWYSMSKHSLLFETPYHPALNSS